MKKQFISCPYCSQEVSLSGSHGHVKFKHGDKVEDFKTKYPELKKQAVTRDTGIKAPVSTAEPPKIEAEDKQDKREDKPEDKQALKALREPVKEQVKSEDKGDYKPAAGKSFLRELDEWLSSSEF